MFHFDSRQVGGAESIVADLEKLGGNLVTPCSEPDIVSSICTKYALSRPYVWVSRKRAEKKQIKIIYSRSLEQAEYHTF